MPQAIGQAAPIIRDDVWIAALRGPAGPRDQALAELHALLLRAVRFELGRPGAPLAHLALRDVDDRSKHAAEDALTAILGKLDSFWHQPLPDAFNGVPLDVIAERLNTNRARYQTLHDPGRKAADRPRRRQVRHNTGNGRGVRHDPRSQHLQGCPACSEDQETLRDFVRLQGAPLD